MSISVRVIDSSSGCPVADLVVTLHAREDGAWPVVSRSRTDSAGRINSLSGTALPYGSYRLVFETGEYFAERAVDSLYGEVIVSLHYQGDPSHLHVPLLLSPFSYTTYRGLAPRTVVAEKV
ncbi:hydroxyisourate hydrolase [Streptomyces sp. BE308]|uniref:hydroxyisourate hydrolase n=1 Tax=unclassified Streptomyces TaxID=2593676 RepID=UPI002DDC6504|nr:MULTISPECIES: hydroxyisourate hydrolase [unclassified Streptomyces]MEE1795904.1 hydroxyisourate hydrolase [Streptomyces sp. BE308]WRZ77793.1 hydroxyisourate hydrolase [Streptomyces sp. NBC_01237]